MLNKNRLFRIISTQSLSLWLLIFALLPFILIGVGSFMTAGDNYFFKFPLTLNNYRELLNPLYLKVFLRSLSLATATTIICILIGYPCAYRIARLTTRFKSLLLILMIIPFWTSSLIRVYSLIILLRTQGLLNHALLWLGLIHTPFEILYTQTAVLIGSVYSLLPFMILPLYANLEKFDWQLIEAAKDLGATRWTYLWKIVLPLTIPGILSGIILVFLPTMTLFFIPDILGGSRSLLLGNVVKNQFLEAHHWPLGSAVSMILTALLGLLLLLYLKINQRRTQQEFLT